MESENRGLDLEKELTCSICTEVLYQPLTLLDCLHTFCGSCLKEWFSWQLTSYRNSPNSLPAGSTPYTCPSCRAPVRDTKPNATVTTLLEMFMAANPGKGKTAEEKDDAKKKYTPGDEVLPKVEEREKTLRERRVEDADRRLMNEVRDLSLREVGVESSEARRERRRREESRLQSSRPHTSRDTSREGQSTEDRERRHRREAERRAARDDSTLQPAAAESTEERRRRRSNEERRVRRHEETSQTAARQIEHQSSLRSLISGSDGDSSREMEEEILRQIREEGLLDGIDLENIDVSQEDQISERIAEAFRRRQLERSRQETARNSNTSQRRQEAQAVDSGRETSGDDGVRTSRRRRTHSNAPSTSSQRRTHSRTPSATSATSQGDQPISRPPQSMSAVQAAHLDVQSSDEGRRRRRRTASSGRSSTDPISGSAPEARPAARSATDLSDRPQSMTSIASRPLVTTTSRSTTDPTVPHASELPAPEQRSRQSQSTPNSSPRLRTSPRFEAPLSSDQIQNSPTAITERPNRAAPPADIVVPSVPSAVLKSTVDRSLVPAPLSPRDPSHTSLSDRANALSSGSRPQSSSSTVSKTPSKLYPEPSLTCNRCAKPHIEYDLHYNCATCSNGNYNICLSCYREGLGCLHWFGFGYAAWTKWEKLSRSGELPANAGRPHMLTPSRYIPPRVQPGGAEGRRTLTHEDPEKRLQSGAFCANCLAWANDCYFRCDTCNEGDWGFCYPCVIQGRSCTHPLLPLTYIRPESSGPPLSPTHEKEAPPSASILRGPGVRSIGNFQPLTFSTKCDICRYPIQPSQTRYHCFSCSSKWPGTLPGDYDICTSCYSKLVASRRISVENGSSGWRRCLQGHRMIIIRYEDTQGGQRRVIVKDLVGGRGLTEEPSTVTDHSGGELQKWSWGDGKHIRGDDTHSKLVTIDVIKTAPVASPGMTIDPGFPPDGGVGMASVALWKWYPKPGADDELLFPKGAEVRECKDVNGDWFHGTYMGKKGLFPSPYVKIVDQGPGV